MFVVFDIEPRRARTRILKTTKKFPCRIIDRGHFYFARRGQSYYAQKGQSRVPEGVKLTRLFHLLLDKNSGSSYESVADDPYESKSESESKDASEAEKVDEPVAEVDPVDHYRIQTVISGYPIKLELDIDEYGNVNGRYAYISTLNKYGDKPSSWFTLSGTKRGRDLTLEATHDDYGHFENWFVELTGSPERPGISGSINNLNTREMFYLNSNQKKEYYGDDVGDGYYEEAYEPETL